MIRRTLPIHHLQFRRLQFLLLRFLLLLFRHLQGVLEWVIARCSTLVRWCHKQRWDLRSNNYWVGYRYRHCYHNRNKPRNHKREFPKSIFSWRNDRWSNNTERESEKTSSHLRENSSSGCHTETLANIRHRFSGSWRIMQGWRLIKSWQRCGVRLKPSFSYCNDRRMRNLVVLIWGLHAIWIILTK